MNRHLGHALFLHGAGGGGWEWQLWAGLWRAHGWHCWSPDLVPIVEGLEATGLDDYRAQVRGWLDAAVAPTVVIGASLGGLLALAEAGHPRVAGLVLVNPVPPAGLNWPGQGRRFPDRVRWAGTCDVRRSRRALPLGEGATWAELARRWRDESGRVLTEAHAGLTVARPGCRTLLMAAAEDTELSPALQAALADWLAADLIRLPGQGHLDPLLGDRASTTAEAALAWFRTAP